ncbi:MAG: porin family protein [Alphaproteobacteria bacterium]|nr:porin family protein [Alphaproteobacteria bacterium]
MKTAKILFVILAMMPVVADAAIPYRVQQTKMPVPENVSGHASEAFARLQRFYVGGAYNFAMWQNGADDVVSINGKNTSSFEVVAGLRIYDTFRLEANYLKTRAEWNKMSFDGDTFFVNALIDARIDNMYRLFHKQMLVPYVGVGAGLSWNSADDGLKIDNKITPVAAALAGIAVEFGSHFALDFGYRYFYMFEPKFDVISDYNPAAHQFRVGARVNF